MHAALLLHGLLLGGALGLKTSLLKNAFQLMTVLKCENTMTGSVTHLINSFKEISVRVDAPAKTLRYSIVEGAFVYTIAGKDHAAYAFRFTPRVHCAYVVVVRANQSLDLTILIQKSVLDRLLARFYTFACNH